MINNLEVVKDVERLVLANLPKRLGDAAMAAAVGVKVPELRHAFLDVRGVAIYQALYRLRLEMVEKILESDPTRSPEAVAFECGFGHYGVFHRRYRRFLELRRGERQPPPAEPVNGSQPSSTPGVAA